MLFTLLSVGSRGDTQPFIALGLALRKKGHRVRIAASETFQAFVEQYGLEFARVRGDVAKVLESGLVKDAVHADSPLKFFTSLPGGKLVGQMLADMTADLHDACKGADAVVYHPGAGIGYFAARQLNIPSVLASPFPMAPTREFPALLFYDGPRLGPWYNRLTHKLFEQGFWMMSRGPLVRHWRQRYGRAPQPFHCPYPRQRTAVYPTVISCSPSVFPRPADWPEHVHSSGYWFLDADPGYQPPPDLQAFLASGDAPVYVGFGSISDRGGAAETTRLVIDALRRAGKRGVIATGWNAMEQSGEPAPDMLFIEGAPHDWLFTHMAAVVHHGGAGTTAAAFRAGVPAVVVPYGNDQFAWGRRIYELGAGSAPIPRKRLTADLLAAAIQTTQAAGVRERAWRLGEQIRRENGAADAADVIIASAETFHGARG